MLIIKKPILATSVLHSHDDPDWYTPMPYVDAARQVMGDIDLDPASHPDANLRIKATCYYTKEQDGLTMPWFGRVFLNPPGGQVVEFWTKLLSSVNIEQAIWIGYSLEQLQTFQTKVSKTPLDFPTCFLERRIAFVENPAKREARRLKCLRLKKPFLEKTSPSHGNYISYLGIYSDRFAQVFQQFGQVGQLTLA